MASYVDWQVRDMVSRCTCPSQFPMIQVSDGKYRIGDSRTLIFVRVRHFRANTSVGAQGLCRWISTSYIGTRFPECNFEPFQTSLVTTKSAGCYLMLFVTWQILRNHVMVRIGGGWDTLENYLDRHDPCRCRNKGKCHQYAHTFIRSTHSARPNWTTCDNVHRWRTSIQSCTCIFCLVNLWNNEQLKLFVLKIRFR